MAFFPFLILATLAWVILSHSSWPWWTGRPYAPVLSGFGIFVLTCEILWLVFGAGGMCGRLGH